MRIRVLFAALPAFLLAASAHAAVKTFPSAQTIPPSGALPQGAGVAVDMATGIGEREGAWIVVTGAQEIAASVEGSALGPLKAAVYWGHYVSFGGRAVPDALLPWDGSARRAEKPNQPIYLQVLVPPDAKPGGYRATVRVSADGKPTVVPVTITVYNVRIPDPAATGGNLLTSFHVTPESYVNKVNALYHLGSNAERVKVNDSLFAFLSDYRISPSSWGFGEPKSTSGYTSSPKWWLDAAGNMAREGDNRFATMRIPISSQRASVRNWIAGISPFKPESWCDYLGSVRKFWESHGWLSRIPYLYTLDEPGLEGQRLVARQATEGHRCFPGSRMLLTGNPTSKNRFLWDGQNGDDVDIWVVLSRRFYGQFTNPKAKVNRARQNLEVIGSVRKAGKTVWSYTYSGIAGTPGYAANEPLSDPRMLQLWNAAEGIQGTLYGQGTVSYGPGNPLDRVGANGEFVLIYPGATAPIASARLEQIRDGIEDWAVLDVLRRKRGLSAVRTVLAGAGLFSFTAGGAKLACHLGCELPGSTKFSWPQFSHDAATAAKIEVARLRALKLAAG